MFFIVFPLLVLCTMSYVLWHVWCILPLGKVAKWLVVMAMAACLISLFFFLGGKLDHIPLDTASVCYNVSTSSIIILLYLLMTFLVADVLRLVRMLPSRLLHDSWSGTLFVLALMLVIFISGNIHYRHKVRVPLELTTSKHLDKEYKIVMVSDLHLGYHNRRSELARWVDLVNAEKPDLVLVAGDIIDISVRPLMEERMARMKVTSSRVPRSSSSIVPGPSAGAGGISFSSSGTSRGRGGFDTGTRSHSP